MSRYRVEVYRTSGKPDPVAAASGCYAPTEEHVRTRTFAHRDQAMHFAARINKQGKSAGLHCEIRNW